MDAVHREIMEEKAGALLRTERRLLDALAVYREQPGNSNRAADLMWDLVDAVTSLVVQREACGLRDAKHLFKFYDVPREVIARIGIRRV